MRGTVPLLGFAEPLSSWLHIAGAVLALLAIQRLVARGESAGDRRALATFGLGAALALGLSGAYHALDPDGAARAVLQRLDHAGIWILIAATFTPVHWILFRGIQRWGVLAFIWTAAICGVVLKTIFFAGFPESLGLVLYLALGWVGAASAVMVVRAHGPATVRPMLIGGVLYSAGGAVSVLEPPALLAGYLGHHEVFHLAVLAALYAHWQLMAALPAGLPRPAAEPLASPAPLQA
ncbi:MAG TPA: hemolysin III family protein [Kofleriaceae bacterium]|nr:hemolysin III family protein [Kofleriaceae bacterium]